MQSPSSSREITGLADHQPDAEINGNHTVIVMMRTLQQDLEERNSLTDGRDNDMIRPSLQ